MQDPLPLGRRGRAFSSGFLRPWGRGQLPAHRVLFTPLPGELIQPCCARIIHDRAVTPPCSLDPPGLASGIPVQWAHGPVSRSQCQPSGGQGSGTRHSPGGVRSSQPGPASRAHLCRSCHDVPLKPHGVLGPPCPSSHPGDRDGPGLYPHQLRGLAPQLPPGAHPAPSTAHRQGGPAEPGCREDSL